CVLRTIPIRCLLMTRTHDDPSSELPCCEKCCEKRCEISGRGNLGKAGEQAKCSFPCVHAGFRRFSRGCDACSFWFRKPLLYPTELRGLGLTVAHSALRVYVTRWRSGCKVVIDVSACEQHQIRGFQKLQSPPPKDVSKITLLPLRTAGKSG